MSYAGPLSVIFSPRVYGSCQDRMVSSPELRSMRPITMGPPHTIVQKQSRPSKRTIPKHKRHPFPSPFPFPSPGPRELRFRRRPPLKPMEASAVSSHIFRRPPPRRLPQRPHAPLLDPRNQRLLPLSTRSNSPWTHCSAVHDRYERYDRYERIMLRSSFGRVRIFALYSTVVVVVVPSPPERETSPSSPGAWK